MFHRIAPLSIPGEQLLNPRCPVASSCSKTHVRERMFSNRCRTEISPLDAERLLPTNPKRFSHFEELGAIWGFEICLNSKAT